MLVNAPLSVSAKGNCDSQGGLFYLGNTKDDSRSIWLSATTSGSFRLDAAQGNTTVDQWTKSQNGLHVTASPFVSQGNGGVHKLYDTSGNKDCLIDTQNQKNAFVPPHILFPIRPNNDPSTPKPPTNQPTNYIATGSSAPRPTAPTLPGSEPAPRTPFVPPEPAPFVGAASAGRTPVIPSTIDRVNPAGVVTVLPEMSVDRRPPDDRQFLNCPDARTRATLPPGTRLPPECEDQQRTGAVTGTGVGEVPITPGRDLGVGTTKEWNVWADANFINVSDGRYGLDVTGWSRVGTVGLDRRITSNFVLGMYVSMEDDMTGGFGGLFSASSRGPTVGPYAALTLSRNWAIDGSLGYSRLTNNISVAVLDGSFVSQRLTANLNVHAQYDLDWVAVRPRLTGYYIKTLSDGYSMVGNLIGQPLNVSYGSSDYDYATLELAAEVTKMFTMKNGDRLMPFAEVGTIYEAVRPNGGQILSSDLQLVAPSPWSFQARAGVRMLLSDAVLLEARAGYLSFGQSGLDVVEAKLHVSVSF